MFVALNPITLAESLNLIFIIFFAIELILKLVGFGPRLYFASMWHWLDFMLVIAGIFDSSFNLTGTNYAGYATKLLGLRLLRLFKLGQYFPAFRRYLKNLKATMMEFWFVFVASCISILIFTVVGYRAFYEVVILDTESLAPCIQMTEAR